MLSSFAHEIDEPEAAIPTVSTPAGEEALLAAAKSGNEHAFEILVERYRRRILAVGFRLTRVREDAEDIAQQCFQKAFVHLQRFKGKSSFSTWLTRIAELFYMVYNVSYAAFSFSAGKLSNRVGAKIVIVCGYLLLVAGYAVLGAAVSLWSLMAGFFLLGFFPALTDGVQRSFAAQLSGAELRGGAFGLLNAANGFGLLFAGIGGGYLWQAFNSATALVAAAAVVLIGLWPACRCLGRLIVNNDAGIKVARTRNNADRHR